MFPSTLTYLQRIPFSPLAKQKMPQKDFFIKLVLDYTDFDGVIQHDERLQAVSSDWLTRLERYLHGFFPTQATTLVIHQKAFPLQFKALLRFDKDMPCIAALPHAPATPFFNLHYGYTTFLSEDGSVDPKDLPPESVIFDSAVLINF